MIPFLRVMIRIISKPEDTVDDIEEFLTHISCIDTKKEKVPIQKDSFVNAREETQYIYTLILEKKRHVRKFTENFFQSLPIAAHQTLLEQIQERIDDECRFYLRLQKKSAFQHAYELTDSGDCVHFTFVVEAHPARKERAVGAVESFLNTQMKNTI
ncbi:MAG: RNA-binding domain-containing protein [Candidatus Woesearchaeota archaeon]